VLAANPDFIVTIAMYYGEGLNPRRSLLPARAVAGRDRRAERRHPQPAG
jgi:hypothetical protein